jgi:hypothetical protein
MKPKNECQRGLSQVILLAMGLDCNKPSLASAVFLTNVFLLGYLAA